MWKKRSEIEWGMSSKDFNVEQALMLLDSDDDEDYGDDIIGYESDDVGVVEGEGSSGLDAASIAERMVSFFFVLSIQ